MLLHRSTQHYSTYAQQTYASYPQYAAHAANACIVDVWRMSVIVAWRSVIQATSHCLVHGSHRQHRTSVHRLYLRVCAAKQYLREITSIILTMYIMINANNRHE
jgi:hypothetical protein